MAPRKSRFTRRQRLLFKTLTPGVAVVLAGLGIAFHSSGDQEAYTPGEDLDGITRELDRRIPEGFSPVPFREVAREAGLDFTHFHGHRSTQLPEDMGSGLAWGDYDGDGDPDLYLVNEAGPLTARESWGDSPASNRLYRNDGDGTFTDVTEAAGVAVRELGMGAAWGDHDSDGDLDLLVTNYGSILLFQNRGDGSFAEISSAVGLRRDGYWAGASWGDFDRDGDLDLYVCGYVEYRFDPEDRLEQSSQYTGVIPASLNPSTYRPHENVLFENRDGSFVDVSARAGVANEKGRSLGATWCDFDEDGWPDLYVANDISDNVMYRNRGDGSFEDISHPAWVADYRGAMGIAVADWDGDRDLDMFISHWIAQENALYVNLLDENRRLESRTGEPVPLRFADAADATGLGQIALDYVGWGSFFFDADNDGRPDLFVANGSTFQQKSDESLLVPMRSLLFWNRGPGEGFFEVGEVCGEFFRRSWVSRGAAPADYDGDGDVDFAVIHIGERVSLLRNDLDTKRHWLGVRLRSSGKNTFGVGARVSVHAGGADQVAVVGATPSYLSQPDLTLHFGLGEQDRVERLEVLWPSGRVQTLTELTVDRVLTVEESP